MGVQHLWILEVGFGFLVIWYLGFAGFHFWFDEGFVDDFCGGVCDKLV